MRKAGSPLLKNRFGAYSVPAALAVCGLALALVVALLPISKAAAYYSFGTVEVSSGSSHLSVTAGSSASTSISVTPSSDNQTLGCGMAKCPQVCEDEGAVSAGYHCFDTNGQCTCAGSSYSTYYPEVSAQSSNSGVATAYVSGGTLVVTGHSAGSATITVNASLRQWESNSTTIDVEVSAPVSSGSDAATSGSSGAQVSGNEASNTAIPEAAQASDAVDNALNEVVVETVAGKVYKVQANGYLNTAEQLNKIKGTQDQAVFWSGSSSEKPDYSWTFVGTDITDASQNLSFDPTITVSKLGTGDVSNIVKQAKDALVMEFAHAGALPGSASLYVLASGVYADGTELSLYTFNTQTKRFELAQADKVRVSDGYASFKIDHCSTWALSTDDLTSYQVEEVNTPGAIAVDKQDSIAASTLPEWVVPAIAGGVIAVVALAAIAVLVRRKKCVKGAEGVTDEEKQASKSDTAADGDQLAAGASAADGTEIAGEPKDAVEAVAVSSESPDAADAAAELAEPAESAESAEPAEPADEEADA